MYITLYVYIYITLHRHTHTYIYIYIIILIIDIRSDTLKTDQERPFYVLIGPEWGVEFSQCFHWTVPVQTSGKCLLMFIYITSSNIHSTFIQHSLIVH